MCQSKWLVWKKICEKGTRAVIGGPPYMAGVKTMAIWLLWWDCTRLTFLSSGKKLKPKNSKIKKKEFFGAHSRKVVLSENDFPE